MGKARDELSFRELEWLMRAPGPLPASVKRDGEVHRVLGTALLVNYGRHAFSKEEDLRQDEFTRRFKEKRHRELAFEWLGYHEHGVRGRGHTYAEMRRHYASWYGL